MKKLLKAMLVVFGVIVVAIVGYVGYRRLLVNHQFESAPASGYDVVSHPMLNIRHGRNEVWGVVLHQTCTKDAKTAVRSLTSSRDKKSAHVMVRLVHDACFASRRLPSYTAASAVVLVVHACGRI